MYKSAKSVSGLVQNNLINETMPLLKSCGHLFFFFSRIIKRLFGWVSLIHECVLERIFILCCGTVQCILTKRY